MWGRDYLFGCRKGTQLRMRLEAMLRKVQKRFGYLQVITPHIGNKMLYVTSGHYAKYGKDSFQPIHTPEEGEEYLLKPMNCPHHREIYKVTQRSYKDLPLRFAEFGTVCRYEQSGELHGLTRVRSFTQDDAHIFCRPDQVEGRVLASHGHYILLSSTLYEVPITSKPRSHCATHKQSREVHRKR